MLPCYQTIMDAYRPLLEEFVPPLSAMANLSALLWSYLPDLNWAGFYLRKGDTLYLGPFQGKIACQTIRLGRGVCGTAALTQSVQRVEDVHAFPGHIACDAASRSEIVLPLMHSGQVVGVLDLDSPLPARFTEADAEGLQALCDRLMADVSWEHGIL